MAEKKVRNFDAWLKKYLEARKGIPVSTIRQLERLSQEEKVPFHDVAIQRGMVSLEQAYKMARAVSAHEVSPVPDDYSLDKGQRLLSKRLIDKWNVLPLEIDEQNNSIILLTSDPSNLIMLDEIRKETRLSPKPIFSLYPDIKDTMEYENSDLTTIMEEMGDTTFDIVDETDEVPETTEEEGEKPIIVRIVNSILSDAIQSNASDVHIEPMENAIRIRFRIDGILIQKVNNLDKRLLPSIISRVKILSSMDISETRRPQDGSFRSKLGNGKEVDFRASTMYTRYGEKAVLRLTPRTDEEADLDSIGLSEEDKEKIKRLTKSPYGLLLATGPTGSGKTTTLYGILGHLNTPEKNIVTIEEPIEKEIHGVNQTSVNHKADITFSSGLKTILRQDPDILMVGEIRDTETAETTIQAALTGHLVLSTLHTNDAAGAITRLQDMGIESYKIPSSVLAVIAQRLIRTNCSNCTVDYKPTIDELAILRSVAPEKSIPDDIILKKGEGCKYCNNTGYKGRKGIFEILVVDSDIKDIILNGGNTSDIKKSAIKNGMKTMEFRGVEEVLNGNTTVEELQRVIFIQEGGNLDI